jgi:hypothetical protein
MIEKLISLLVLLFIGYVVKILLVRWLQAMGREEIQNKVDESMKPKAVTPPTEATEDPEEPEATPPSEVNSEEVVELKQDLSQDYNKQREHVKKVFPLYFTG